MRTTEDDRDCQGTTLNGKLLRLGARFDEVRVVFCAHRNRLIAELSELTGKEWIGPSRCHLWSVADVTSHLVDVNRWSLAGLRAVLGDTKFSFMKRFDNRLTPHQFVKAGRGREEILDDLAAGTERVLTAVDRVRELGDVSIRTPIGYVSLTLMVLHLLWDSWLHERDVLEPLNGSPTCPEHEVRLVASYAFLLAGVAISSSATPREQIDIMLDGPGGGYYRIGVGETIHVEAGMREPDINAMVRGPILSTIDALAGRGDLENVVNGSPGAIRLLCALSAMMTPQ